MEDGELGRELSMMRRVSELAEAAKDPRCGIEALTVRLSQQIYRAPY